MMHLNDLPDPREIKLQRLKVAAQTAIGRQLLADSTLKQREDTFESAANNMWLMLESNVLAYDDGTAEQEVFVDAEVGVSWRQILSFLFGGKRTVKDRVLVKVKARKWTMFPENNIIFPSDMGNPVVRIRTWVGDE